MWRLGAIRDSAAGLVKQGAGAVKQGVAVGAKFLENLEEEYDEDAEGIDGDYRDSDSELGSDQDRLLGKSRERGGEGEGEGVDGGEGAGDGADRGKGLEEKVGAVQGDDDHDAQDPEQDSPFSKANAFGLDPDSEEYQGVKGELERLGAVHASELRSRDMETRRLRSKVRRIRQEAEGAAEEAQLQLQKVVEMLNAAKTELADKDEELSMVNEALGQERVGHREDVDELQGQINHERAESEAEKQGLQQTIQMLQRELGAQNASMSEVLSRCEEKERALSEADREMQELRDRVSEMSEALDKRTVGAAGGGGGREGEAGEGDSPTEEIAAKADGDDVKARELRIEELEKQNSTLEESFMQERAQIQGVLSEFEKKSTELEHRLAEEQARAQGFCDELEAMRGRVIAAEKHGDEAISAAATEASRAAQARELLEASEAELKELRQARADWEDESARAAELKATLEITRDALDEARNVAGQAEATAERRGRDLERQGRELRAESERLRQELESGSAEASNRLRAAEAEHEAAVASMASRAADLEAEIASIRGALEEAEGRAEASDVALEEVKLSAEGLDHRLEEAQARVTSLEDQLSAQGGDGGGDEVVAAEAEPTDPSPSCEDPPPVASAVHGTDLPVDEKGETEHELIISQLRLDLEHALQRASAAEQQAEEALARAEPSSAGGTDPPVDDEGGETEHELIVSQLRLDLEHALQRASAAEQQAEEALARAEPSSAGGTDSPVDDEGGETEHELIISQLRLDLEHALQRASAAEQQAEEALARAEPSSAGGTDPPVDDEGGEAEHELIISQLRLDLEHALQRASAAEQQAEEALARAGPSSAGGTDSPVDDEGGEAEHELIISQLRLDLEHALQRASAAEQQAEEALARAEPSSAGGTDSPVDDEGGETEHELIVSQLRLDLEHALQRASAAEQQAEEALARAGPSSAGGSDSPVDDEGGETEHELIISQLRLDLEHALQRASAAEQQAEEALARAEPSSAGGTDPPVDDEGGETEHELIISQLRLDLEHALQRASAAEQQAEEALARAGPSSAGGTDPPVDDEGGETEHELIISQLRLDLEHALQRASAAEQQAEEALARAEPSSAGGTDSPVDDEGGEAEHELIVSQLRLDLEHALQRASAAEQQAEEALARAEPSSAGGSDPPVDDEGGEAEHELIISQLRLDLEHALQRASAAEQQAEEALARAGPSSAGGTDPPVDDEGGETEHELIISQLRLDLEHALQRASAAEQQAEEALARAEPSSAGVADPPVDDEGGEAEHELIISQLRLDLEHALQRASAAEQQAEEALARAEPSSAGDGSANVHQANGQVEEAGEPAEPQIGEYPAEAPPSPSLLPAEGLRERSEDALQDLQEDWERNRRAREEAEAALSAAEDAGAALRRELEAERRAAADLAAEYQAQVRREVERVEAVSKDLELARQEAAIAATMMAEALAKSEAAVAEASASERAREAAEVRSHEMEEREAEVKEESAKAISDAHALVASTKADLEGTQEALRVSAEGLQESRYECSSERTKLEQSEVLRVELTSALEAERGRLAELDRELDAKRTQLQVAVRETHELRAALEARGAAGAAEAAAAIRDAAEARTKVAELEGQLEKTFQALAAIKEALAAREAVLDEKLGHLEVAEQQLRDTNRELEVAKQEAAIANDAVSSIANEAATAAEDHASQVLEVRAQAERDIETAIASLKAAERAREEAMVTVEASRAASEAATARAKRWERDMDSLRKKYMASLDQARADHAISQAKERRELERAREADQAASRDREAALKDEIEELKGKILQVQEEHAKAAGAAAEAKKRVAQAASDAESAARVVSWEKRSLREELEGVRERSEQLSSALREAHEREEAARKSAECSMREEMEALREAVRRAEAAKERAEDGLEQAKNKKKRDLQEVRRLNERMFEMRQATGEETLKMKAEVSELKAKAAQAEQAMAERDELRRVLEKLEIERQDLATDGGSSPADAPRYRVESQETVRPPAMQTPAGAEQNKAARRMERAGGAEAAGGAPATNPGVSGAGTYTGGSIRREGVVDVGLQVAVDGDGELGRGFQKELEASLREKAVLVAELQEEVAGSESKLEGAIAGRKEADAARETLAASLGRANARIAQLTSQNSQLTRARSAMVSQIRALEAQAYSATLAQPAQPVGSPASAPSAPDGGKSEVTSVGTGPPVVSASRAHMAAPVPVVPTNSSISVVQQRRRAATEGVNGDVEAGAVWGRTGATADGGQGDNNGGEADLSAGSGDYTKSVLSCCSSNPVWAATVERVPWMVTWLNQQPPQTLWSAAMAYLGLVHLTLLYKVATCH